MIAVAIVAVFCGGALRTRALLRRAAFHAREQQSCLHTAQAYEYEPRRWEKMKDVYCGSSVLFIEMEERYEAMPGLRQQAAYHAELAAKCRRAVWCPWFFAPVEKPFVPDDQGRPPESIRFPKRTGI